MQMIWWQLYIVSVLAVFVSCLDTEICDTQITGFSKYTLIPRPINDSSNSSDTYPPNCFTDRDGFSCGIDSPLVNGVLGSVENQNSSIVHAWNRSSQRVSVQFRYTTEVQLRHLNLFFYNIPSMKIGLPTVSISAGPNTLNFYMTCNQNLSAEDNTVRNVVLSLVAAQSSITYTLVFDFTDSIDIDWLLLSEIKLCNSPQSAIYPGVSPSFLPSPSIVRGLDNITSNITLSCTVQGEGTFRWQWTSDSGILRDTVSTDTTRTSIAYFTHIQGSGNENNDPVSFRCTATYDPTLPTPDFSMSNSNDISVTLKSALDDLPSDSSTLACELFGYFEEDNIPEIFWSYNDNTISSSNPSYSINITEGSRLIQDGGADVRPSIVSKLNILVSDSSVIGSYICRVPFDAKLIEYKPDTISSTTPTTSSSTVSPSTTAATTTATTTVPTEEGPSSSDSSFSMNLVIIIIGSGILVSLIVVILLVMCAIIVVVILRRKNASNRFRLASTSRKDSLDYTGEPYYQEVPKPAPPPIPDHFPAVSSEIEAYATVNNMHIPEVNGHLELKQWPQATLQLTAENDSGLNADQLHVPFLERNPLYASSDNLDEKSKNNPKRNGSVPSLDVLTDSPQSSQLNIYAKPSILAPPVPERPSTPDLIESVYKQSDLSPTVFQSQSPTSSPPANEVLPCFSVYDDPQPLLRSEGPKEITLENIQEVDNLGFGQFGQVLLAKTVGLSLKDLRLDGDDNDKNISIQVAVKKLKSSAEPCIREAFEKEIKFMSRLHNENVVRLLAICPSGDPFIVMEYMENGDLNQFLHKHTLSSVATSPEKEELTRSQLTYIPLQIASGMKYLASFKFIHRDLATRNCLVGSNLKIKIADFGMSRSLYSSYYYRISGRAMLPIRWMANECFYGKFSEKTDVWAFGVTMWEVFTFAREQPYQGMSDQEVIDDAIKGPDRQLLAKPDCCPPEVYEVMKRCWIDDPNERAKFKDVHSLLEAIYNFGDFSE